MSKKLAQRGSERLLEAWNKRVLTDESVVEIAKQLDESPAIVLGAHVTGGGSPTGVSLSLAYEGDDVPRCGNDIMFWLQWLKQHGGRPRPPKILINGIPFPDLIRLELEFGDVGPDLGHAIEDGGPLGGAIRG